MIATVMLLTAALSVVASGVLNGGSVAQGAQRVSMLNIEFHATCSADIAVQSLTVHHHGLGPLSDISRVYAVNGIQRLTRGSVLHLPQQTATIRFTPPLVIAKCSSRSLSIDADISPDAISGSEHSLSLDSVTDINAGATTVTFSSSKNVIATMTASTPSSLSVTFLPIAGNSVLFGTDRMIARFQITSSSSRDQLIDSMMLTNDGSARNTDLQNLRILSSGKRVLTQSLASLNGSTATFLFNPALILPAHSTLMLEVHADVRASRTRTIRLTLEEPSDLSAHLAMRSLPSQ